MLIVILRVVPSEFSQGRGQILFPLGAKIICFSRKFPQSFQRADMIKTRICRGGLWRIMLQTCNECVNVAKVCTVLLVSAAGPDVA